MKSLSKKPGKSNWNQKSNITCVSVDTLTTSQIHQLFHWLEFIAESIFYIGRSKEDYIALIDKYVEKNKIPKTYRTFFLDKYWNDEEFKYQFNKTFLHNDLEYYSLYLKPGQGFKLRVNYNESKNELTKIPFGFYFSFARMNNLGKGKNKSQNEKLLWNRIEYTSKLNNNREITKMGMTIGLSDELNTATNFFLFGDYARITGMYLSLDKEMGLVGVRKALKLPIREKRQWISKYVKMKFRYVSYHSPQGNLINQGTALKKTKAYAENVQYPYSNRDAVEKLKKVQEKRYINYSQAREKNIFFRDKNAFPNGWNTWRVMDTKNLRMSASKDNPTLGLGNLFVGINLDQPLDDIIERAYDKNWNMLQRSLRCPHRYTRLKTISACKKNIELLKRLYPDYRRAMNAAFVEDSTIKKAKKTHLLFEHNMSNRVKIEDLPLYYITEPVQQELPRQERPLSPKMQRFIEICQTPPKVVSIKNLRSYIIAG